MAELKVLIDKDEFDKINDFYQSVHSKKPPHAIDAVHYVCIKREYPGSNMFIVQDDDIIQTNDRLLRENRALHNQLLTALDEVRARDGKTVLHRVGRGFSGKELLPPDKNFWDKVKSWIYTDKQDKHV